MVSPYINHFIQPDTIIPDLSNPQSWNRFGYVQNNPINFNDPTGHCSLGGHWMPDDSSACQWGGANQGSLSGTGNGGFLNSNNGGSGGSGGQPNIPDPIYNDNCEETALAKCVDEADDEIMQIAHTIFGEGGSESLPAAANVMQVMLNRSYIYWTCWQTGCSHSYINGSSRIPWENISKEQFIKLMLFVLSEPYGEEAAFNAWTEPYPNHSTGTTYWSDVNAAVTQLINSPVVAPWQSTISVGGYSPVEPIRSNVNVQYYVSFPLGSGPRLSGSVVWVDPFPSGRNQYYGTYPMNDD